MNDAQERSQEIRRARNLSFVLFLCFAPSGDWGHSGDWGQVFPCHIRSGKFH